MGWLTPKYVWITYSFLNWRDANSNNNTRCTPEMLKKMLNGMLAIAPENTFVSDDRHTVTTSGLVSSHNNSIILYRLFFYFKTPHEYEVEYLERLGEERYRNFTEVGVAASEFDAMWAMALGLHNAAEMANINDSIGCDDQPGELVSLNNFDYLNDKMGCVLRKSFQQVNFLGVTVSRIMSTMNNVKLNFAGASDI